MRNAALILVLMLGFALKASTVLGAENDGFTEVESSNDVAHYVPARPAANANAAAAASASATSDGQQWDNTYVEPTQNQTIQNNNNITVGSPATAANVNSMNQGVVPGPQPVVAAGAVAYANDDVSSVLGVKEAYVYRQHRLGLTPLIGGSWYATNWNDHIGNNYTFGLILDIPMNSYLDFELEGGYARYNISYGYAPGMPPYSHYFNQYLFGSNLKTYLIRGDFRPFIGGGLMGVCYENMSRGPAMPVAYNQCIGSAQLLAGAEFDVSRDIALGVRGAWLIPMFNRPYTMSNAYTSAPGYEEAAAINTSFYKLMATMRIAL